MKEQGRIKARLMRGLQLGFIRGFRNSTFLCFGLIPGEAPFDGKTRFQNSS
jgi:hypothetical protein